MYTKTIVGKIGASHQPVFSELVRISLDSIYYPIFNITIIESKLSRSPNSESPDLEVSSTAVDISGVRALRNFGLIYYKYLMISLSDRLIVTKRMAGIGESCQPTCIFHVS